MSEQETERAFAALAERCRMQEEELVELREQRSWLAAVADCHDRGELLAAGANIEEVEKRWPGWRAWI